MGVMKLGPVYKDALWGGEALARMYGKQPPAGRAAESWELACHKNGSCSILTGPYASLALDLAAREHGEGFYGPPVADLALPLIFKLIDAAAPLSLQVHPDDASAPAGERGKTEMWAVLAAKPESYICAGFRKVVDPRELRRRIAANTLEPLLNWVEAREGDVIYIPAGMVHALGPGLVIAEIQQSSDLTYRIYDWGRTDADGQPRELHIEQALAVTDTALRARPAYTPSSFDEGCRRRFLPACPHFAGQVVTCRSEANEDTCGASFHALFCTEGFGRVGDMEMRAGDTLFVTADTGRYDVTGKCAWLRFWLPDFERDVAKPLRKAGIPEERIWDLWHGVDDREEKAEGKNVDYEIQM